MDSGRHCQALDEQVTDAVPDDLEQPIQTYIHDIPTAVVFTGEFRFWVRKCNLEALRDEIPGTFIDSFKAWDSTTFLNIEMLHQIEDCVYESECSYSKPKRIHDDPFWSTMTVSALALMKVNRADARKLGTEKRKWKVL